MAVLLALNVGSSSIKFALHALAGREPGARVLSGQLAQIGARPRLHWRAAEGETLQVSIAADVASTLTRATDWLLDWLTRRDELDALAGAGHRVVHGGERFTEPVIVDQAVIAALTELVPLARLHQPYQLEAIAAARARWPSLPQVACFDTAFHHTIAPVARSFALPRAITATGVRRYGFHGISYAYIASRLPALLGPTGIDPAQARVLVAHLGSGSSMCALRDGLSVDTTMGFTALDGLMMATRAGRLDPGVLLYLLQERGVSIEALSDMLYRRSGLLGVSGTSASMSELLASDSVQAREAVALFVHYAAREAGALIATLRGLDALVFTAGIGEHAAAVRAQICAALAWLGIALDSEANARNAERISTPSSAVSVWVVPTDEEAIVARATAALISIP